MAVVKRVAWCDRGGIAIPCPFHKGENAIGEWKRGLAAPLHYARNPGKGKPGSKGSPGKTRSSCTLGWREKLLGGGKLSYGDLC